jgi:hypothetical protein
MKRLRPAASFTLVVALAACSSGHKGGQDGPTAEEACADQANAFCERLGTCAPYSMKQAYGDAATCIAREKQSCLPGFNSVGTSRSPAKTQACADGVSTMSCDTYLYAYSNHVPDACMTKPGALPDGAACGGSSQCSSTRCSFTSTSCGVCADRAPVGAACTVNSGCEFGLLCVLTDPALDVRVCVKPAEEGEPCNTSIPCRGKNVGELRCIGATATTMGVCRKPVGLGAACDPIDNLCDWWWVGVNCDPTTNTCQPIQLVGAGQPCGTINNADVECAAGGVCDITDTTNNVGTCKPPLADGSPCDPNSTVDLCLWPSSCTDGVCKMGDPAACK